VNGDADPWMGIASWWIGLWFLAQLMLVGVWDVWCISTGNGGYTVSSVVRVWAGAYPALPFGIGMLMGHLFWR